MKKRLSDEQRLEKTAIKAFRQRWKKIVRDIEEGRKDYVGEFYPCFEADTAARAAEYTMNRINGREGRNYHTGINF